MQTEIDAAEEVGQINFRAYCEAVNNTNIAGNEIPAWEELNEEVKAGWRRGAMAVGYHVTASILRTFEGSVEAHILREVAASQRQAPKNG